MQTGRGVLGALDGVSGSYLCGRGLVRPELAAGVRAEGSFVGGLYPLRVRSELGLRCEVDGSTPTYS